MIRKITSLLAVAALLAAVPLAAAQDEKPDDQTNSTDDAAWVEDCPPDMMCAMNEPADEEPTYSGDCGAEMCAYDSHAPTEEDEDYVKAPEGSESGITSVDESAEDAKNVPTAGIVAGALALAGLAVAARRRA